MAEYGSPIGGLLQGFNQTYWPGVRANEVERIRQEELALRKAQDERANALQQFQMQKYSESEAKDRQAAGLYAGLLGIKPTTSAPRTEDEIFAAASASGDFMGVPTTSEQANPQYEQFLAGGAKAGADMVKMTREQQLAELKARSDAWKEANAQRLADIKDKQIMAMIARTGQGGVGSESKQPIVYVDDNGNPVWGTIREARGRAAASFSPETVAGKAAAAAGGTARGKREYNMEGVTDVIDRADELLNMNPTDSGIGAAADRSAAMFGIATKGSIPAQELKQLSGFLTSKMPRMEGPQSDKDVQMYKEMAGLIGDDTVPVARRIAALRSVRQIVAKYDKTNNAATPQRVRMFNPQTGRLE